ncbi:MAG: hypothetical protein QXZ12_08855 [Thermoplasmata archaeon]
MQRKHIFAERIRYIGKESNNLEETEILGIGEDSYLEYQNLKEFYEWILALKPRDVTGWGISERGFKYFEKKIKNGKFKLNTKIGKTLLKYFKNNKIQ